MHMNITVIPYNYNFYISYVDNKDHNKYQTFKEKYEERLISFNVFVRVTKDNNLPLHYNT